MEKSLCRAYFHLSEESINLLKIPPLTLFPQETQARAHYFLSLSLFLTQLGQYEANASN